MCRVTVLLLFVWQSMHSQDAISSFVDVNALTELPLESLLNVRKHLDEFKDVTLPAKQRHNVLDADVPEALPLSYKHLKPKKRGGYYIHFSDDNFEKKNKKSITSIFQLSVTTLAFLAFGGYLVYLVVAAIRAKNNNNPQIQIMSALTNPVHRRKRKRKKKRRRKPIKGSTGPGGHHFGFKKHGHVENQLFFPRVKREDVFLKATKNTILDGDDMYATLINLSEGYARFYAVDFVKTNYTSLVDDYYSLK